MNAVVGFLLGLPTGILYAVLGLGAAVENFLPPIPADTFVLLGGFLAGRGRLDAWTVFAVTWSFNVIAALSVYWIGRRYGRTFFESGAGRYILHEGQLARMRGFYERWGVSAIFFTRFLPGFRAVVPVFAGVSHQSFVKVAVPLTVASGIWYGALVWLGATTARNLGTLLSWLSGANRVLLVIALVVAALVGLWWWKTRRERAGDAEGSAGDGGG